MYVLVRIIHIAFSVLRMIPFSFVSTFVSVIITYYVLLVFIITFTCLLLYTTTTTVYTLSAL